MVLDPQVSPEEIKRREVVLDPQASPEEIKSREVELGLKVGLLSPQLYSNGGATGIVFVTVFCIAVGKTIAWCGGRCEMPDGHDTALTSCCSGWRSTAAVIGLPGWRLVFGGLTLPSLFFPLVPVPNRPSRLRLRPRKPEGSLGRTAQDGHLDSHTAPELWRCCCCC